MIVNNEGLIPSKIYKYVDFITAEIIVNESTLLFSDPAKFNDPLDCHISNIYFDLTGTIDESVRKDIEMFKKEYPLLTIDEIQQAYEYSQKKKIEKAAVCCFSLGFDNELLWAHYADKHNGVCLEFDYSLPRESIFTTINRLAQGHVQYHFTERFNYCESKFYGFARLFMSKSAIWDYEEEFRLLTMQGAGIYQFNPLFLTKVIFGVRTLAEDRLRLVNRCSEVGFNHIQFVHGVRDGNKIIYRTLD